jgi:hypothetical protein
MKMLFVLGLIFLQSVSAQANTFVGKIGPFMEHESVERSVFLSSCHSAQREIKFFAEKSAKYHMPEVVVESIVVVYKNGRTDSFSGRGLGEVKRFVVEINEQSCPSQISIKARAAGFIPSGSKDTFLSIWLD